MNFIKKFCIYAIIVCPLPSFASSISNQIIDYLSKINLVAIEFKQINHDNTIANGQFILAKPYNFRCNYYAPYPLLIVGNKHSISLYDFEMQQLTRVNPNDESLGEGNILINLLLNNGNLRKLFNINLIKTTNSHYLALITNYNSNKKIVVSLSKQPLKLSKIEVINPDLPAKSRNVVLDIISIKNIKNVSPILFSIKSPKTHGYPKQLEKNELKTNYKIIH